MGIDLNPYNDISADDKQFINDIKTIIYTAKQRAYQAADIYQVVSNWLVGRRIVEQEQHGQKRAKYGKHIIELASEALTAEFGKGYSVVNIKSFRKFYLTFNNLIIGQALSAQFDTSIQQIVSAKSISEMAIKGQTLSAELELGKMLPSNLSWSHYERLMRIEDEDERDWLTRPSSFGFENKIVPYSKKPTHYEQEHHQTIFGYCLHYHGRLRSHGMRRQKTIGKHGA